MRTKAVANRLLSAQIIFIRDVASLQVIQLTHAYHFQQFKSAINCDNKT